MGESTGVQRPNVDEFPGYERRTIVTRCRNISLGARRAKKEFIQNSGI